MLTSSRSTLGQRFFQKNSDYIKSCKNHNKSIVSQKIKFNIFWTEDLILRKLAEKINSIRSIDKKLLSNYQLTRFENTVYKNSLKVKYYVISG